MPDDIGQLALAGAQTMVTAMATDGWAAAKEQFGKLVAGHEKRLEQTRLRLAEASPAEAPDAKAQEVSAWTGRVRDALEDDPTRIAELRRLIADLGGSPQQQTVSNTTHIANATNGASVTQITSGRDTHMVDSRRYGKIFFAPVGFLTRVTKTVSTTAVGHTAVAATIGTVVVVGAVTGVALSQGSSTPSGTRWQGTLVMRQINSNDSVGADLTAAPPTQMHFPTYAAANNDTNNDIYVSGDTIFSHGLSLARWTESSAPTALQCQKTLADSGENGFIQVLTGDQFCVSTHNGGFAFIRITAVNSSQATMVAQEFTVS